MSEAQLALHEGRPVRLDEPRAAVQENLPAPGQLDPENVAAPRQLDHEIFEDDELGRMSSSVAEDGARGRLAAVAGPRPPQIARRRLRRLLRHPARA